MRIKHLARSASALLALAFAPSLALAETARLQPRTFPAVNRVDERFQSYNVEMAEIIGGRFWRSYAKLNEAEKLPNSTGQAVALNAGLFATRPPVDLSTRRLRVLAAALGPSYVRVSGSWANTLFFQNDDGAPLSAPPKGYQGVLTRAQWRGVIEFARAVDAKLVTSFAINAPVRDAAGVWTPLQAGPFIDYTRSIGGEIYAAELFNEPNLSSHAGGPKNYDGLAFARDSASFQAFINQASPKTKILGPGDVSTANLPIPGAPSTEDLLLSEPRPRFDIFDYHFYNAVSQRCAPPTSPAGTSADAALSEEWLARPDKALQARKPLRDRYAPQAPIWITETAGAACGGAPWSATFLDTFRYVDQMGRLAKQGVNVIFHNTLAASDYGLIDDTTFEPRPNYWAALLWRRLMGPIVLDPGQNRAGLHLYAHCLRDRSGGVSVVAINNSAAPAKFEAPLAADLYILSAPTDQGATVLLNGRPLAMRNDDRLPKLEPRRVHQANVEIKPRSLGFIALPNANNLSCK